MGVCNEAWLGGNEGSVIAVCDGAWLGGDEGSVMGVCAGAWLGSDEGSVMRSLQSYQTMASCKHVFMLALIVTLSLSTPSIDIAYNSISATLPPMLSSPLPTLLRTTLPPLPTVPKKVDNLIFQSKATVIDAAKRELSSGFKPIGLVFGGLVGIDSHMSGQRLEKKVTDMHGIVTRLSDNVTYVHSSLGDEIAKLTVEVSKLSTLISKEPPNPEVERKMDAILAATEKLVSEYVKRSEQKKNYGGLRKAMHGFVTWLFDD
ncbi:hypothetical protein SO802_025332 [Lithocarpus litseifolius]|uniref:Uncharacterized protein n=1 Tax=Lithocarpus litseifolius TaxID=425828 RepID=A0AAW2BYY2_9ROSI